MLAQSQNLTPLQLGHVSFRDASAREGGGERASEGERLELTTFPFLLLFFPAFLRPQFQAMMAAFGPQIQASMRQQNAALAAAAAAGGTPNTNGPSPVLPSAPPTSASQSRPPAAANNNAPAAPAALGSNDRIKQLLATLQNMNDGQRNAAIASVSFHSLPSFLSPPSRFLVFCCKGLIMLRVLSSCSSNPTSETSGRRTFKHEMGSLEERTSDLHRTETTFDLLPTATLQLLLSTSLFLLDEADLQVLRMEQRTPTTEPVEEVQRWAFSNSSSSSDSFRETESDPQPTRLLSSSNNSSRFSSNKLRTASSYNRAASLLPEPDPSLSLDLKLPPLPTSLLSLPLLQPLIPTLEDLVQRSREDSLLDPSSEHRRCFRGKELDGTRRRELEELGIRELRLI